MSEENVEIVRQMLNTWIEIDEGLAEPSRAAEFLAPDVALRFEDAPGAAGVDEFVKWRAEMSAPYDDGSYSLEKILDAGGKRVVGTFLGRGKLRGTDDWVDWRYGVVWTVEEGLITEATMYTTQEKALEAAGLAE